MKQNSEIADYRNETEKERTKEFAYGALLRKTNTAAVFVAYSIAAKISSKFFLQNTARIDQNGRLTDLDGINKSPSEWRTSYNYSAFISAN